MIDVRAAAVDYSYINEMVYQPMRELLIYLRANGFKTFIVSGGSIEFMRPWTEKVYGVPPEQVVGSSIESKFEMCDGKPVLVRLPARPARRGRTSVIGGSINKCTRNTANLGH